MLMCDGDLLVLVALASRSVSFPRVDVVGSWVKRGNPPLVRIKP